MRERTACRICGYLFDEDPWGEDGESPTYWICPCCGGEAGFDDRNREAIRRYRRDWIFSGANWFEPDERPDGWRLADQLVQVPDEFQ